jgi:hypothetical protein
MCSSTHSEHIYYMSFQVLTAASIKMTVFWDVAWCELIETDRRFRENLGIRTYRDNILLKLTDLKDVNN